MYRPFSNQHLLDQIPEGVEVLNWLKTYVTEMNSLQDNNNQKALYSKSTQETRTFAQTVSPLLGEINWNQDTPYNNMCPTSSGTRCMTGCVATAMARVMKYHNYPLSGKGSYSYTT